MSQTRYDYISLKNQYVQGTMSLRELCRMNDIKTWSTVSVRAARDGWEALRAEFQRQVQNKSLEALAEKRSRKIVDIQLDALEVIHAGVLKMAADMDAREPVMDGVSVARDKNGEIIWKPIMRFGPTQLATLIDKFQTLIGQPSQVTESRTLNANLNSDLDHDDLRSILASLRPKPALGRPEGAPEVIDPERTRPN